MLCVYIYIQCQGSKPMLHALARCKANAYLLIALCTLIFYFKNIYLRTAVDLRLLNQLPNSDC